MRKKKATGRIGCCPKCMWIRKLQRHHVLPVRFFGKNKSILLLCENCHKEIEKWDKRNVAVFHKSLVK